LGWDGRCEGMTKLADIAAEAAAFRKKGVGEDWSPEKRGRALLFIWTLANAHHTEWKSKAEIWRELQQFKD